ncbi:MAG: hypothetical protein IT338_09875 [Thermomicrobiales bacterium]|nr:hypothetical protein [Thermomicrobiales bacterium]
MVAPVASQSRQLPETPPLSSRDEGACARELALGYLQYACASWRGEPIAPIFATRLGAYWQPELAGEPVGVPDAFSPHGGGGRGIAWYHRGDEVYGYVLGTAGGFRVPDAVIPRLARCIAANREAASPSCGSPIPRAHHLSGLWICLATG